MKPYKVYVMEADLQDGSTEVLGVFETPKVARKYLENMLSVGKKRLNTRGKWERRKNNSRTYEDERWGRVFHITEHNFRRVATLDS